jgi:hypothetical protein
MPVIERLEAVRCRRAGPSFLDTRADRAGGPSRPRGWGGYAKIATLVTSGVRWAGKASWCSAQVRSSSMWASRWISCRCPTRYFRGAAEACRDSGKSADFGPGHALRGSANPLRLLMGTDKCQDFLPIDAPPLDGASTRLWPRAPRLAEPKLEKPRSPSRGASTDGCARPFALHQLRAAVEARVQRAQMPFRRTTRPGQPGYRRAIRRGIGDHEPPQWVITMGRNR